MGHHEKPEDCCRHYQVGLHCRTSPRSCLRQDTTSLPSSARHHRMTMLSAAEVAIERLRDLRQGLRLEVVLGLHPAECHGADSRLQVVLAERLVRQEIPGMGDDVMLRVVGQCDGHAVCIVRRCGQRSLTIASVMPSYPLAPTVWTVVAATRSSRDRRSCKRRTPRTLGSVFASSTRAPSRTTLSTTISVPGLESLMAQSK